MKLCAVQRQQHLQSHSGVCRDPPVSRLPCAMSTESRPSPVNGLCGGGGAPPSPHMPRGGGAPPSPHMPPSSPLRASLPSSPTKQQLLGSSVPPDTNGDDTDGRDEMIKKENVEVDGAKDWKDRVKAEEETWGKDVIKQETTDNFVKVKKEIKGESLGQENSAVSQLKPATGGRLKFFKEGRVLLELTHRVEGDKGIWVPTTKKVYWPPGPPATPTHRLDSNASAHTGTGSEGSLDNASVHSHPSLSPWQPNSPRPSSHYEDVAAHSPRPTPSWQPAPPHRVKSKPVKLTNPPQELLFALKTLQGIKNYRKKMRTFRRKCRQPCGEIRVGVFLLKLECNAASVPTTHRKPSVRTASQRSARLETLVTKVSKLKSQLHVPITAWKTGRTDLSGLVKGPPSAPNSPVQAVRGVVRGMPANIPQAANRVRSELRPVTETCTAAMATVTTSRFVSKVKAETRTVTAETRHVPVKTLPVTPTVARIKPDPNKSSISSSLVANVQSPDIARVKMEVCHAPQSYIERGHAPLNYLDRDPSFASPRKRFLRDFENGSPSAKNRRLSSEHRLSTDSMGSSDRSSPGGVAGYRDSPGGVAGYREPYRPTPSPSQLSPAPRGQPSPRPSAKVSNFSIDSIMGGGGRAPSSPTPSRLASVKRETAPNSPARSPSHQLPIAPTPTRPSPTPMKSEPPSRTPPPVNPYAFSALYPHSLNPLLDPRLAHLQSLADPRLAAALGDPRLAAGQSPYPFQHLMSGMPAFPGLSPYLPISQSAPTSLTPSYPSLWTPPVSTPRTLPRPPSPSNHPVCTTASSSTFFPPPSSSLPSSSSFPPSSSAFASHASQYRGEPKVSQRSQGAQDDAPLNLSMKK